MNSKTTLQTSLRCYCHDQVDGESFILVLEPGIEVADDARRKQMSRFGSKVYIHLAKHEQYSQSSVTSYQWMLSEPNCRQCAVTMKRRRFIAGASALLTGSLLGRLGMSYELPQFVVPPEEGLHELTFMQWPVSREVYPESEFLYSLQQTIAGIANSISEFEPVVMLTAKKNHKSARAMLSSSVQLWDIPTEDLWCRDSGPLFGITTGGDLVVSHIEFNGWGEKQSHYHDSKVANRVAEYLGVPVFPSGLRGEAGGVEHNGHGLLMAHESSWINENRNPGLNKTEIEKRLLQAYGAKRMIWSEGVRGNDITDYHIDSLARFVGRGKVLINLPDEPDLSDPFHLAALDTYDVLVSAGLEVFVIPEPNKIRKMYSADFVASYVNYYVCNGGVIAARFGDSETDKLAEDTLRKFYPEREIVSLNVDALGEIGGGIHCATQQMPAR